MVDDEKTIFLLVVHSNNALMPTICKKKHFNFTLLCLDYTNLIQMPHYAFPFLYYFLINSKKLHYWYKKGKFITVLINCVFL